MAKKTKVRVIESTNNSYNFLEIQIIKQSYNTNFIGTVNVLGSITFQQTIGENDWYAMRFVASTDRAKDLLEFGKLAVKIENEATFRSQPKDILNIIDGIEYYLFKQEFFKVDDKGKYCFNVIENGSIYARLVAKDTTEATKKIKRFKEINSRIRDMEFIIGESFLIE
jgi:hypothetical protein